MFFSYLVKLTRGFNLAPVCDPKIAKKYFWPMLDNVKLNSASLTQVILFDPKHFVVDKSVWRSII